MGFLSDIPRRLNQLMGRSPGASPEAAPPATITAGAVPVAPGPIAVAAGPGPVVQEDWPARYLETAAGASIPAARYPFGHRLEIGRAEEGRTPAPGQLLLSDPSVSWRHCVITQTPDGRCTVRDVSRNGTRVNGRRLVPNVETELELGHTLEIGPGLQFVLMGEPTRTAPAEAASPRRGGTNLAPQLTLATVLVGDIRDYTVMVRKAPGTALQQSVNRVFEHLTAEVEAHHGTVKEFPGDAIMAFWEGSVRGEQAVAACRAALALNRLARRLATDRSVWSLEDFPLRMDFALASGSVVLDSFGGDSVVGLSMVGEPVVLAHRLEKMADDRTGPILVCRNTHNLVSRGLRHAGGPALDFTELDPVHAKGFDYPEAVFALHPPKE